MVGRLFERETMNKTDLAELDKHFPPCGPCGLCGFHDKRHRLWDSIMGNYSAGDTADTIADNYSHSIEAVLAVLRIRPYKHDEELEVIP